ncbi:hypothetical protein [Lederbergia citri]|uniref:Uncharacterized protein n=1 Tax=Lederbergia citri TaxID=2833580 RepID=A0A942TE68_9BACI|nr:hypothetical protein [Lederbergia citri]MBS4196230.1 hypothetical protein [Lederbergia citri]
MDKSNNWIKESLEHEVFENNPFNEDSKKRILQRLNKREIRASNNPFNKMVPAILTVMVFVIGSYAIGSFAFKELAGNPPVDNKNEIGSGEESNIQVNEPNENKNDSLINEKTFRTYGINPEKVGVDIYADISGFYPLSEDPFAAHEHYPLMDFGYVNVTEKKFIMTGQEIDEIHDKFPEISIFVPAGVFYEGELIQAVFDIGSGNRNTKKEEEILEEIKKRFPTVPIFISFSDVSTGGQDEKILIPQSFGYGLGDYSYIQNVSDALYAGNINTILELSKTNKQFVDESKSIGENDMLNRAYKTMAFEGYFIKGSGDYGSFPNGKSDILKAGTLQIWSEVPLNIPEQQEAINQMIATIEHFYDTKEFALIVTYRTDPNFLNEKSKEEYGGWSVGYKMPNNPNVIFKHLEGIDPYNP